jgi:hypothetical protein
MSDIYAVLRPSLLAEHMATVVGTHDTLEAAMAEQREYTKRYGWASAIVRKLNPRVLAEHGGIVGGIPLPGDYIRWRY